MSTIHVDPPEELRELNQWVVWRSENRNGKPTKVPYNPRTGKRASPTDPGTWVPFNVARKSVEEGRYPGYGFVFTADDPYTGVDLDDCFNDGELTPIADEIVRLLDTYTEISPSGHGVKMIVKGTPLGDDHVRKLPDGRKIEMYSEARFFTITGESLWYTKDTIESRHHEVNQVYRQYVAKPEKPKTQPVSTPPTMDDYELIDRIRDSAQGSKFGRLMARNLSDYGDDHSSADQALCNILAFWTRDENQIDRIFKSSGLYRDKWDSKRGDSTYGAKTIAAALDFVTETYTPPQLNTHHDEIVIDENSPCAEQLATLKAQYEARLAERDARITELETDNHRLRTRLSETMAAIGNEKMRPNERIVSAFLLHDLEAAPNAGRERDGEAAISQVGIAKRAGVSEDTAAKVITRICDTGKLAKHRVQIPPPVDPETGEIVGNWRTETRIRDNGFVRDGLAGLVKLDLTPTRPKQGGKREPARCPEHPNADIIEQTIRTCAECGEVIEEGAPRTIKSDETRSPLLADSEESPSQSVVNRTYTPLLADSGESPGEQPLPGSGRRYLRTPAPTRYTVCLTPNCGQVLEDLKSQNFGYCPDCQAGVFNYGTFAAAGGAE